MNNFIIEVMAQYIDKSALVAEIEGRLDGLYDLLPNASKVENGMITISEACNTGKYTALESFKDYVDTLEVKEVDLEKTINDYFKDWKFDEELDIMVKPNNYSATFDDIKEVAKHFYELGLSVNNPITAADRGMAEEIIINLKRVEQDYRIDLTKEIEWLRNQVKKGE